MVERCVRDAEVEGSNPFTPTNFFVQKDILKNFFARHCAQVCQDILFYRSFLIYRVFLMDFYIFH